MIFGEYKELDEALYTWFRQQRELDHSVSSCTPREARVLFEQLYPESTAGFCSKEESFFRARRFFHNLQQKHIIILNIKSIINNVIAFG